MQSEPALGSENPSFQGLTALNHRGTRRPPGPVESRAPSALANRSSSGPRRSTGRGSGTGAADSPEGGPGPHGRGWQRMSGEPLTIILEALQEPATRLFSASEPPAQAHNAPRRRPQKLLARRRPGRGRGRTTSDTL